MKILVITPWFPEHPNAQNGNYILGSICALRALDIDVSILVMPSWRWRNKKINLSLFPSDLAIKLSRYFSIPRYHMRWLSNFLCYFRMFFEIKKLVKDKKVDLLHVHNEVLGASAILIGKKLKIPVVLTIHGLDTTPRLWRGLSRKMIYHGMKMSDRLLFVGEPLWRHFAGEFNDQAYWRIVPNGVSVPDGVLTMSSRAPWSLPLRLISVSNLHEGKGVEIAIKALAYLKKEMSFSWIYTIVGDGVERKTLENLVIELNLEREIRFVGACDHNVVFQYLMQADVFCLPSYREAFGICYLEAMACGLLTMAVEGEGASAFIENGKTGLLMKPRSVNDLVRLLKYVFENPEKMQSIANNARNFVLSNWTWEHHAKKLMDVYQEII